ncbi:MAG TPA: hypothetical protein DGB97_06845 [Staphylococcus sp.]|nr:hypothetical protein [Staphylococcus sp.]
MAYEYEKRNKGVILTGTIFDEGDLEKQPAFEEVEEVYAKAKAFNKISDVIKKAEFYDRDTALDIIEIVEELEDK